MIEFRVKKISEFADRYIDFEYSKNYEKVIRFADDATARYLEGCLTNVKDNAEKRRKEQLYNEARKVVQIKNATTLKTAISLLEQIPGYLDADELLAEYQTNLNKWGRHFSGDIDSEYVTLSKIVAESDDIWVLSTAFQRLSAIANYKDCRKKMAECESRIAQLKREQHQRQENLVQRIAQKRCMFCGGQFTGIIAKKCSDCGRAKNY